MRKELTAYEILGVKVNAITETIFIEIVMNAIKSRDKIIIASHNLHSVYLYHKYAKMRSSYSRASYVYIDGMPLIFAGKLKGLQLKKENRITSLDWLNTLMRHAVRNGWRIFFLGSKPEVVKKGVIILKEKFPGLQISAAHGYFDVDTDSEENKSITSLINNYNPNILMVGMGMPRQEYWTFDNSDSVSANVIINIGAIMDYVSGAIPTPPRWSGKLYLEWLFRLAAEPKRLFFRYIIEPILLIGILISKKIKKDKNHA